MQLIFIYLLMISDYLPQGKANTEQRTREHCAGTQELARFRETNALIYRCAMRSSLLLWAVSLLYLY